MRPDLFPYCEENLKIESLNVNAKWKSTTKDLITSYDGFSHNMAFQSCWDAESNLPGQKEKIKLNFCFHTSLWCLKRFYEEIKAFIKTFEAPTRSVKIKN